MSDKFDSPFENVTLYCEVDGQPMRFVIPEGIDLITALAQASQSTSLMMEPLAEGSMVKLYEEPLVLH